MRLYGLLRDLCKNNPERVHVLVRVRVNLGARQAEGL